MGERSGAGLDWVELGWAELHWTERSGQWMPAPDMKEDREEPAVRLISVHDGLSPFRRFSLIHPSLISSFKIVFGQLHMRTKCARTHTRTHA